MSLRKFVAEFIGTFALIFVGVGAIASNHINGGQTGLLGIALAHGLTIAVMVSATMAISGGHLNPAITIGFLLTKKINFAGAVNYIIAQCLGAIAAAYLLKFCFPALALAAVNFGTPSLMPGLAVSMGLITEIILTFFLMFVIFGTAVDPRAPKVGGLFIGLTVTLDILIGGPLTGAAMNPARHLGPALISGNLSNIWLYWAGPVIGSVLAAFCYDKILQD